MVERQVVVLDAVGSSPDRSPHSQGTTIAVGRVPGLFALALAGGAARRMGGGDKPLLEVGGRTMLARVVDVLAAEADSVAISANGDPARFATYGVRVLADGAFVGRGPLAGVLAGLQWAAESGGTALLTLPGDTPFAPPNLAARLAPAPACAESAGRVHHLVALWPVPIKDALARFLTSPGPYAVHGFARTIGMRTVAFTDWQRDPFANINTVQDLMTARDRGVLGPMTRTVRSRCGPIRRWSATRTRSVSRPRRRASA